MSEKNVLDEYISQRDLAAQLNKCVRTLKRWRALRYGPRAIRIGKSLVYHREDVARWLEAQRTGLASNGSHHREQTR
jgi:hypothetical protein